MVTNFNRGMIGLKRSILVRFLNIFFKAQICFFHAVNRPIFWPTLCCYGNVKGGIRLKRRSLNILGVDRDKY